MFSGSAGLFFLHRENIKAEQHQKIGKSNLLGFRVCNTEGSYWHCKDTGNTDFQREVSSYKKLWCNFSLSLHSADKDILYTVAPSSDPWCTDQLRRAQPVAGRCSVEMSIHPLVPSIPTHWERKPSHPQQTLISPCLQCATLQYLSSMNRLCLWHCPPFVACSH